MSQVFQILITLPDEVDLEKATEIADFLAEHVLPDRSGMSVSRFDPETECGEGLLQRVFNSIVARFKPEPGPAEDKKTQKAKPAEPTRETSYDDPPPTFWSPTPDTIQEQFEMDTVGKP